MTDNDWGGVRKDFGQHGEPCLEDGHVFGCAGAAGGDHELDSTPDPEWTEDENGYVVAPLVNRGTL